MPRSSNARQQFVEAAAQLLRRQGYHGTALAEITACSGAPRGSLYHYFPDGKAQLGAEAVRWSGEGYRHLLAETVGSAPDPVSGLLSFFDLAADALEASDFADGCPIATTALDTASRDDELRRACASVFDDWLDDIAAALGADVGPERARRTAVLGLSTLEGAIALSRTLRSTQPLREAAEGLRALLGARPGPTGQA